MILIPSPLGRRCPTGRMRGAFDVLQKANRTTLTDPICDESGRMSVLMVSLSSVIQLLFALNFHYGHGIPST